MLASTLSKLLLLLSAGATALKLSPPAFPRYGYSSHVSHIRSRQDGPQNQTLGYYPVTGVLDRELTDGSLPVRREIREMEKDQDLWTLYLLGLDFMQATQQEDPASWYKIMGIHGMPYESWDGVPPVPGFEQRGYCTHMSALFLSWHRPWLALYEQILYGHIQFIATLYESEAERARYADAARRFRIPYWDWAITPAAGEGVYPRSVQSPSVDINGPFGVQTIANPLYSYLFHPFNAAELSMPQLPRFANWDHTLRSPSTMGADAVSRDNVVGQLLNAFQPSIQTRLYNLFATYNNYTTFSNSGWIFNLFGFEGTDDYSSYDSIESIHDLIHGVTGDGGHMQIVDISAFDPLFMLHHTMVDRVWSMWQLLNPKAWIEPQTEIMGSYTIKIGQVVDSATPLTPFHDAAGKLYTSDDARRTEPFGYTYPETVRRSNMTDEEYRVSMIEAINLLYGEGTTVAPPEPTSTSTALNSTQTSTFSVIDTLPTSASTLVTIITTSSADGTPTNISSTTIAPSSTANSTASVSLTSATTRRIPGVAPKKSAPRPLPGSVHPRDNTHREYLVMIKVPKQALNKPFFIHVFLGPAPAGHPREWCFATNLVGSHAVFSSVMDHRIAVAGAPTGGSATSTIPLTAKLTSRIGSQGLGLEQTADYMQQNLKYRIVTSDGEVVENARLVSGGMAVEVASALVQARASDSEFPSWGPMEKMFTVDEKL